jgi:hypothetical protein
MTPLSTQAKYMYVCPWTVFVTEMPQSIQDKILISGFGLFDEWNL